MPSQPDTAIQLNYKVGGAMVNLYADDANEATELNAWLEENVETVAKTQALLDAAYNVHAPQQPRQQAPAGVPAQRPAPAQGGAPQGDGGNCGHGDRVFKSGTGKTGKPWSAWMCPTKAPGCEPVWNRG
jgi:hypothetical protein